MAQTEQKHYTIAIMTGDTQSEYSEELMRGFYTAAKEEGVNLVVLMGPQIPLYCTDIVTGSNTGNHRYQFDSVYQYTHFVKPDAVIIMCGSLTVFSSAEERQSFLRNFSGIPCVSIQDRTWDENMPYVISDNYSGMKECMEHLIAEHGYRRIVYLSGPENNYDARERLCAYRDSMERHGIAVTDTMIAYGDYTDHIEEQVRYLLEHNEGVEAIVCANDSMAKGCYRVCTMRNLIVGKDIAITGFNDTYSSCTMNPTLTSVSQNNFQISYYALKSAVALCRGEQADSFCRSTVLKKRCSCGCLPVEIFPVRYIAAEEIEAFINDAVKKMASHIFSMVSYEKDHIYLTDRLYIYFFYIYNTLFMKHEDFSMDRLFEILKKIVSYPNLSDELLLENLTQLLRILLANARDADSQSMIAAIISSTQQFMHSLRIEKLEQEIYVSNRQSWFVPNFTRDLVGAEYMRNPKEMFFRIMEELKKMAVRSAYFFLFDTTVMHVPGEPICFPEKIGLVACFDEEEMQFYHRAEKPVFTTQNGFLSVINRKKPTCYIPLILFSEQRQYGIVMCEADHADITFLQICSIQLGTLFHFIELNLLEQQAQLKLQNSLQVIKEQNRILSFISEYDELTKLLNRRGFIERALTLYKKNEGKRAYLIFADLDHLKEINDDYGHAEGDFAIRNVAERFRRILPSNAVSGRIGGDELVAFVLTEEEGFRDRVEKAFASSSEEYNRSSSKPYYIELSVGVHEFVCSPEVNFDEMVKKSDKLLYKAKSSRRKSIKKQYDDKTGEALVISEEGE